MLKAMTALFRLKLPDEEQQIQVPSILPLQTQVLCSTTLRDQEGNEYELLQQTNYEAVARIKQQLVFGQIYYVFTRNDDDTWVNREDPNLYLV